MPSRKKGSKVSSPVSVGLIQMSMQTDLSRNLKKAISRIEEAARAGAQIICLPELFKTLYFCQTEDHSLFSYAEEIKGESFKQLSPLAKRHKVVIVAPIFEKRAAGVYHNSALIIDADGTLAGFYRKMHIPDDPNFYEKFYFTPGDLGFRVFQTAYGKVSVLICWDQWFPEGARLAALAGAQILFYPTAIGWHDRDEEWKTIQREAWQTIQRSHAVANGVFVGSVNRVGREGKLNFWGHSFLAGPFGEILDSAHESEKTIIVDCHFSKIEETRQNWPFLRDRRIDSYSELNSRLIDIQI